MTVRERVQMSEQEIAEVLATVRAATAEDGVAPLSEQALLALKRDGRCFVIEDPDGTVAGYAHITPATDQEPASAELVVHPRHRRQGHGRALMKALLDSTDGPLRIWAHGDLPAAEALARSFGLTRARALLQMRRSLQQPELPEAKLADGVQIRTFRPGQDEAAWLSVNRRAFAHHPEQGSWTLQDLQDREEEPWFDPAGFFLAIRNSDSLVGFHWTKVHSPELGEVYVVGVDPAAQGLGLGRALTLTGLHHLKNLGLPTVLLYVDESNASAVKLYESLAFTRFAVDVMYAN
jgi:mycothiol synthase